jgi:hypothetical protein
LYSAEDLEHLYRLYPYLVLAVAGGVFLWLARDRRRSIGLQAEARRRRETLYLVVLLVLLTLAHPRAWRCNYTALLLPCVLLAEQVWRRRPRALIAGAALTAVTLACAWPTRGVGEGGWSIGAWLLLGKHFWAAGAAAMACLWCAGAAERVGSPPAESSAAAARLGCLPAR